MNEEIQADNKRVAALYARVSSERQAEKDLSIPAQLKALKDYAVRRGWTIYRDFVDEAKSARTADRPQFQEMISAARQKNPPFDTILVWKLSRFARNREDSIIYKKLLRKHGVDVVSINEQIDDSPSGRLLEGIIEVIDEFYSANLSHDTIRGMKENAQRGYLNGSVPPYGFQKLRIKVGEAQKWKLEPNPIETVVLKRMFQMCLEGKGAKEIARTLNGEGIRTRRGRRWETNGIQYILRNETATGTLIFNRVHKNSVKAIERPADQEIRVENAHPAIIDKDTFQRAQALIVARAPRRFPPRTHTSNYLLSGLLFCGKCGASMAGCAGKSSAYFYYGCHNKIRRGEHGCNAKLISKKKLESAVIALIKRRILTEENLSKLVRMVNEEVARGRNEVDGLLERNGTEQAGLAGRLDALYAALETGKLAIEDLAPRIKALREQQEALQASRIELEVKRAQKAFQVSQEEIRTYVESLHDLLEGSSMFERKAFLRNWIKRIVLHQPDAGIIEYTLPLVPTKREGPPGTQKGPLEVLSLVQTGGDGASQIVSPEDAPLFPAPETGEITRSLPPLALSWALNWGRITNGERVIEDLPAGPEVALLTPEPGEAAPLYTTLAASARWEQTSNSHDGGAERHGH